MHRNDCDQRGMCDVKVLTYDRLKCEILIVRCKCNPYRCQVHVWMDVSQRPFVLQEWNVIITILGVEIVCLIHPVHLVVIKNC